MFKSLLKEMLFNILMTLMPLDLGIFSAPTRSLLDSISLEFSSLKTHGVLQGLEHIGW